jgi:hypothetical protein
VVLLHLPDSGTTSHSYKQNAYISQEVKNSYHPGPKCKQIDRSGDIDSAAAVAMETIADRIKRKLRKNSSYSDANLKMNDPTPADYEDVSNIEEVEDNTTLDLKMEDMFQDTDFCASASSDDDKESQNMNEKQDNAAIKIRKKENKRRCPPTSDSTYDDSDADPGWGNELTISKKSKKKKQLISCAKVYIQIHIDTFIELLLMLI